jgi:hypothetical protein
MKLRGSPLSRHEPVSRVIHGANPDEFEGLAVRIIFGFERNALRPKVTEGTEECVSPSNVKLAR